MSKVKVLLILVLTGLLPGCQTPVPNIDLNTPLPRTDAVIIQPTQTQPLSIPVITGTPTYDFAPIQLTATVWNELPQVPVLMYHRFNPSPGAGSYLYTTSLEDFQAHLNSLYDAGFSLVSLSDWLKGNINLQAGRRPLMITIDDLFYADQISLTEKGEPAPYSGVGLLWHFSQGHPDFNFAVSLFYNLGDKGYANLYQNGTFSIHDGWRQARAEVIAWSVENNATPLNHFYEHPFLDQLSAEEILWQIQENDAGLRDALKLAGREDLIKNLPNILALPYVVWPATEAGEQVLYSYTNPEGAPVAAIVEGAYAGGEKYLQAPFSHEFSRWHIPRISVSNQAIAAIVEQAHEIPTASSCQLGEFKTGPHIFSDTVSAAILEKIRTGECPYGYYVVDQFAFYIQEDIIIQYAP